jgi:DNA helicase-2/ATP-dependent DNA helicase PcrA
MGSTSERIGVRGRGFRGLKKVRESVTSEQSEIPVEAYKSTRVPSRYQADIHEWVRNGTGNAVIEAVAGSGKTTTILDSLLLTNGKVLFTAFNQSIAAELQKRAPAHVRVATLHSLGLKSIRRATPFFDVDSDGAKMSAIVQAHFPDEHSYDEMGKVYEMRSLGKKVVSLVKATLTDEGDLHAVQAIMDRYGIESDELDEDDMARVVAQVPLMIGACKGNRDLVDFDDMIWFPVVHDLKVERFSWVFVDECQDMNRCQLELVLRAGGPETRFCCVGDRRQAIYGFRGADTEAMKSTVDRLKATVFPLSITYRCPTSHVELARKIVPHIEARPDAPAGTVSHLKFGQALETMTHWDLVICRTNAPLARVAFSLIRLGKKAVIRGRDIASGIVSLIKKIGGRNAASMPIDTFLGKLDAYYDRELAKLTKAKKSTMTLTDKVDTIRVLAEEALGVRELIAKTESIFDDNAQGIVCSSVHRAKGLEADRVFVIAPELMPHPMAEQSWEIEQEHHIKYVSLTRAKKDLYFVELPKDQ